MTNLNQPSTQPSAHPSKLLVAIAALSFLGFADAAYLTADHYFKLPLPCSLTNGCDTVLHSTYSMIGPVPTALLGVVYYLSILFLAVSLYTSENPSKNIVRAIFAITCVGLAASLFLIYLQAFVIHAFCMYCLGSAVTSVLTFIVSAFYLRSFSGLEERKNGI